MGVEVSGFTGSEEIGFMVHPSGGVLMEIPNNAPSGEPAYLLTGSGRHFVCYGDQAVAEQIIEEKLRLEAQKKENN